MVVDARPLTPSLRTTLYQFEGDAEVHTQYEGTLGGTLSGRFGGTLGGNAEEHLENDTLL